MTSAIDLSIKSTFAGYYSGDGYFAGLAPDPEDPSSPDGRFRVQNVPSRGLVTVHEAGSMICVASAYSRADGTWEVLRLNRNLTYTVIGWAPDGSQNAAIQSGVMPAAMG